MAGARDPSLLHSVFSCRRAYPDTKPTRTGFKFLGDKAKVKKCGAIPPHVFMA